MRRARSAAQPAPQAPAARPHALDRILIAVAAGLLPAFARERHREEWTTDALAARSASLRHGAIGIGACMCALTYRRRAAQLAAFDMHEVAIGRLQRSTGWFAIGFMALIGAGLCSLVMDDGADPGHPAALVYLSNGTAALFGAIAAVALPLGLYALWQAAPVRRGGSWPLVACASALSLAAAIGASVQAIHLVAGDDGTLQAVTEPAWTAALAMALVGGFGVLVCLGRAVTARPAARPAPPSPALIRRLTRTLWAAGGALLVVGLLAALVAAPLGIGLTPLGALSAFPALDLTTDLVGLAVWVIATIVAAVIMTAYGRRSARWLEAHAGQPAGAASPRPAAPPAAPYIPSARTFRIGLLAFLAAIPAGWWQASFGLGMDYADYLGTVAPHLSYGDLFPAIGQFLAIAAIWLLTRDTKHRAMAQAQPDGVPSLPR